MSRERELLRALVNVLDDLKLRRNLSEDDALNISDSVLMRAEKAIENYIARSEKNRLIEVYSDLLKSLIENDGAGLKELKAFDLETYNKLKDIFGASDLLAQPEKTEQEPVAWVCEEATKFDKDGYFDAWEACFYLDKPDDDKSIRNVTPLYTAPPKREPIDTRMITLEMFSEGIDIDYKNGYIAGIRFAENYHGIGADIEKLFGFNDTQTKRE